MRWSNTDGIAQCGISRATQEATGCRHWATTHSVLPQRPLGQQANKQQSKNAPKNVAVLMAMATRWYVTMHIARWRRLRTLLDVTNCHHWARIVANRSCMCRVFSSQSQSIHETYEVCYHWFADIYHLSELLHFLFI
jgi:hypothetical protein